MVEILATHKGIVCATRFGFNRPPCAGRSALRR
jgi:hypothetical protein